MPGMRGLALGVLTSSIFFQGKEQRGARGQRHAQKEQEGPRLGVDSALLELLLCLLPFAVGWAS